MTWSTAVRLALINALAGAGEVKPSLARSAVNFAGLATFFSGVSLAAITFAGGWVAGGDGAAATAIWGCGFLATNFGAGAGVTAAIWTGAGVGPTGVGSVLPCGVILVTGTIR